MRRRIHTRKYKWAVVNVLVIIQPKLFEFWDKMHEFESLDLFCVCPCTAIDTNTDGHGAQKIAYALMELKRAETNGYCESSRTTTQYLTYSILNIEVSKI